MKWQASFHTEAGSYGITAYALENSCVICFDISESPVDQD